MARPLDVGFLMMPTESAKTGVAPRWTEILEMARRGEELGYDSLWIPDHLIINLNRPGSQPEGAWEAWSLVAALAAARWRHGRQPAPGALRRPLFRPARMRANARGD